MTGWLKKIFRQRITRILVITLVLVIALLLLAWFWLLHTQSGARWVVSRAESALDMSIRSVEGDLSDGLKLRDIRQNPQGLMLTSLDLQVDMDLLPLQLEILQLQGRNGSFNIATPSESAATDEAGLPEDLSLPLAIHFHDIQLHDFDLLDGDQTLLDIQQLLFKGSYDDTLDIQQFAVTTTPGSLNAAGTINLLHPFSNNLNLHGVLQLDPYFNGDWKATIQGDLDRLQLNAEHQQIHLTGSLSQLLNTPAWDIQLAVEEWSGPEGLTVRNANIQSSGNLDDYQLQINTGLAHQQVPQSDIALGAQGNSQSLNIQSLQLAGEGLDIQSQGHLSWAEDFQANLDTSIQQLLPAFWLPDWPQQHPLSGQIQTNITPQQIEVSDLSVQIAGLEANINGSALVDTSNGLVDTSLQWQSLHWPLGEAPLINSQRGSITISGELDGYRLMGEMELGTQQIPEGALQFTGTGNQDSLQIDSLAAQLLGGQIKGDSSVHWSEPLAWTTNVALSEINPGPLLPQWQGAISADIQAQGESSQTQVIITDLDGTLRGRSVSGGGVFNMDEETMAWSDFRLNSGRSSIVLNGDLYQAEGLDFEIDIQSMADLVPQSSGQIQGRGRFSFLSRALELQLNGQSIVVNDGLDLSLKQFEISGNNQIGDQISLDSNISLQGLDIAGQNLEQVLIELKGDKDQQRMNANLSLPELQVNAGLEGSVIDWDQPLSWAGHLQQLTITGQALKPWALNQPAAIEVDGNHFVLESACLEDDVASTTAELCFMAEAQKQDHFSLSLNTQGLPLNLLAALAAPELEFSQTIGGQAEWTSHYQQPASGQAEFHISPGKILIQAASETSEAAYLDTGPGILSFDLHQGQLLAGQANLTLTDNTQLEGNWQIEDINLGNNSPVNGDISLQMNDLSVLTQALPAIDRASGQLNLNLNIAGDLGQPAISGDLGLVNGSGDFLPLGLKLSDLNFTGRFSPNQPAQFSGQFQAGDGHGEITAQLILADFLPESLNLDLQGDNLQLVSVPNMQLTASPDLQVEWQDDTIKIDGSLLIPSALLAPDASQIAPVSESEDLVLVHPTEEDQTTAPVTIEGGLRFELGDDVTFTAAGASARISGGIDLEWNEPESVIPIANGLFNVEGEYQAYGQILEIREGEIQFPNDKVDNPRLNIQAVRDIFGSAVVDYAGVQISGAAQQPKLKLFTDPPTSEEKALAYVVTGSDFDHANGVGALNLGTYIFPKLFVSYGIGLFETGNVLSARYELSSRWGVKASSGERDTGVDLTYTVDR